MPNKRTELVRGVLIVREAAGYTHGRVAANIMLALMAADQALDGEHWSITRRIHALSQACCLGHVVRPPV